MVYVFFSIIFYTSIASIFPSSAQVFRDERPLLIQLTGQLYIFSCHVFYIVNIITGILRRKKVRRFTLQIETCIRTMNQLNIPMNLSKCFLQQCYLILFLVFIIIIMIVFDYQWLILVRTKYWILVFFYVERYPYIAWLLIDFTFVFWIRCIKIKFSQLNELLRSMLTTTIDSPQHKRVLRMRKNDSPEIHLELIKCARNTNDAYNLHILMSTIRNPHHSIFTFIGFITLD
ncbi:uncharacterized protein LOC124946785 [Vespa velutina]|uniref:uncharacterized protein LOC124946785 n=1 Tax=Vespa velutina TaxID=202808 RepID=UPI001FB3DCBE|nr:uncharacterized protein LOC124946785 [Vespa velutina]